MQEIEAMSGWGGGNRDFGALTLTCFFVCFSDLLASDLLQFPLPLSAFVNLQNVLVYKHGFCTEKRAARRETPKQRGFGSSMDPWNLQGGSFRTLEYTTCGAKFYTPTPHTPEESWRVAFQGLFFCISHYVFPYFNLFVVRHFFFHKKVTFF